MRNLTLAQVGRDAVFPCPACGGGGVVRISVSRSPGECIRRRPNVVAAQWEWVGSERRAKLLVRRLRRQWTSPRYVVGEGYRIDYAAEGLISGRGQPSSFDQTVLDIVRSAFEWEKWQANALGLIRMHAGCRIRRDATTT